MKQLVLVRHGKSDWANKHLADFDRPLNARGHRDAPEMANRILQKGLVPQAVVSSPALRAITTARHFSQVWHMPSEAIVEKEAIYEANTTAMLKVINTLDNKFDRIAVFGHNPGFTDIANYLTDADIYNIPTCGVVIIAFPINDWSEVSHHGGTLIDFDFPKSEEDD